MTLKSVFSWLVQLESLSIWALTMLHINVFHWLLLAWRMLSTFKSQVVPKTRSVSTWVLGWHLLPLNFCYPMEASIIRFAMLVLVLLLSRKMAHHYHSIEFLFIFWYSIDHQKRAVAELNCCVPSVAIAVEVAMRLLDWQRPACLYCRVLICFWEGRHRTSWFYPWPRVKILLVPLC